MSELFAIFRAHLVSALVLWVLFFAGFAMLFAGRRVGAFAKGVLRVLGGIITSPFVFIRRAVQGVLGFTSEEEEGYRASDQYLLNKAMLVLQALVIVVAIGVLSAGAVATWKAWVPSSEIRTEAREYRKRTDEQRTKSTDANAAVAKLDGEWQKQSETAIGNFRREREETRNSAQKTLRSTEEIFATYGSTQGRETLARMQRYANGVDGNPRNIRNAKNRMDGMWWSWGLHTWEPQSLRAWTDHWQRMSLAAAELANVPVDAIRAKAQPAYEALKNTADVEAGALAMMETRSKQLDEAASLKWKAATGTALGAFVTFLMFVWAMGALIEAGWLAIRVADDVRRMRTAATTAATTPVATPHAELFDATQRDVHLPIRERGEGRASLPSGPP